MKISILILHNKIIGNINTKSTNSNAVSLEEILKYCNTFWTLTKTLGSLPYVSWDSNQQLCTPWSLGIHVLERCWVNTLVHRQILDIPIYLHGKPHLKTKLWSLRTTTWRSYWLAAITWILGCQMHHILLPVLFPHPLNSLP